jgi:fucose 4-O-acetylase-like acetyltransferase
VRGVDTCVRYLIAGLALVAAEVAAVAYWWTSEAWDCGVQCSTSQEAAGWAALLLPVLIIVLVLVALVRKTASLRHARRDGGA